MGEPWGAPLPAGSRTENKGGMLLSENNIKNTRIYDLNGDIEAIYYRLGWGYSNNNIAKDRSSRGSSPDYELNRKRTVQKAKGKIRRIIKAYNLDRFVTLTFAENIQDLKTADHEFRKFMKRLARRYHDCQYIAVREFQNRGAVHYHIAINKFIKQTELHQLWGQGFVWIERKTKNQQHLINYLCKYMVKHSDDERLKGYHLYLSSQGLKVPYDDKYFNSGDEMVEYLEEQYSNIRKRKNVCAFQDGNVVWVG